MHDYPHLQAIQAQLPAWQHQAMEVTQLSGGLTNQNYRVAVGNQSFVVRVCAPNVRIHGIERANEQQCARAAAGIGIAPEVIATFQQLEARAGEHSTSFDAVVTRFIAGHALTDEQVRSPERLAKIVRMIRQYHALPTFAGRFDVFQIFAQGLAACKEKRAPLPAWIDEVVAMMKQFEQALQHHPPRLAACHNDLLSANFIEEPTGRIWLIDWEYAGWGDPFFDLGNLSVNNGFDDPLDWLLLQSYFENRPHATVSLPSTSSGSETVAWAWSRLKLMKITSDAREGMWGMVQSWLSSLDNDYIGYGTHHLERFMHNASSDQVVEWMQEVRSQKSEVNSQ